MDLFQSMDSVVEKLLFLVIQPAICRAYNVLISSNFVLSQSVPY